MKIAEDKRISLIAIEMELEKIGNLNAITSQQASYIVMLDRELKRLSDDLNDPNKEYNSTDLPRLKGLVNEINASYKTLGLVIKNVKPVEDDDDGMEDQPNTKQEFHNELPSTYGGK